MGVWSSLARRAIMDHEQGRITVIKLKDEEEYKKMRNGCAQYFQTRRYRLNPLLVEQADGLRVFMELQPMEPEQRGVIPVGNRNNSTAQVR
jgi:hypothetical protein